MARVQRADFTIDAAKKVLQATRRVLSHGQSPIGPSLFGSTGLVFFEGEATSQADRPSNAKTGATTCTASRWKPVQGSATNPVAMEMSTDTQDQFTLVNRSLSMKIPIGAYLVWVRIGNEWRVIFADC